MCRCGCDELKASVTVLPSHKGSGCVNKDVNREAKTTPVLCSDHLGKGVMSTCGDCMSIKV